MPQLAETFGEIGGTTALDAFSGSGVVGYAFAFLDSAWSHIDRMAGAKRALAISALVLSAAREQPRGVFTFTDRRYDDGRRDLRLPMREHFRERAVRQDRAVAGRGRAGGPRAVAGQRSGLGAAPGRACLAGLDAGGRRRM